MNTDNLFREANEAFSQQHTRRHLLNQFGTGLGALALSQLLGKEAQAGIQNPTEPLAPKNPHFPGKAKRVIFLHMAGAPSQLEMFDYKPDLAKVDGKPCPASYLEGKRFAFLTGVPNMLGPVYPFAQHGQSGAWLSDQLPHMRGVVDDMTFIKTMTTDEFNHAPAQMLFYTGFARPGRPSLGAWTTYGLGSENRDLPGFVVLVSGGKDPSAGKNIWGSGFIPSVYQGVQCRSKGAPVLFSESPEDFKGDLNKKAIDWINRINEKSYQEVGDPEILTRIAQYEMAYRMQMSVPEVMTIDDEPDYIHEMYGTSPGEESFANNCLLARRLIEQDVRFVQLFDWGWDHHGANPKESLTTGFKTKCAAIDRPITALLKDLKQRGLLEDTLVVWGGEFGRTPMRENRGGMEMAAIGRDHNPNAFTVWMAGAGVKSGLSYGETDEFGYQPADPSKSVHVYDLQATILKLLGFDHEKFTYHFQGRDFRLTDVHGHVVDDVLA